MWRGRRRPSHSRSTPAAPVGRRWRGPRLGGRLRGRGGGRGGRGGAPRLCGPPHARAPPAVPLLAFYYIWFDPGSWDRAKIDYPQLGHYSSDDSRVMRQHIDWAKSAGIDGFIVSWKDTPTNDRRLRLLMSVAKQADFKLAMIYQGLDFNRNPL